MVTVGSPAPCRAKRPATAVSLRWAAAAVLCLLSQGVCFGQTWGRVAGHVREATTLLPIPGASIVVAGTNFGTAASNDGAWHLNLPEGRYLLRISAVGYEARLDSVVARRGAPLTLDIALTIVTVELPGVTIEDRATLGAGIHHVDPAQVRSMPTPFKGFQALHALPGVAASNELSNQYSVRGGGFNENLIFLNGFEIHMPFRPRQGEQEGLGLLNPELARSITLYTGGFPARYGGKISSTLDIKYEAGAKLAGSAYVSMLDAGAAASASHGPVGWLLGVRRARARRFFSTQQLKGDYQPDYIDVQALFTYQIAAGHEAEVLGIWADHQFNLDPRGRRTYYGIVSAAGGLTDLRSAWTRFDASSQERDGYRTGFLGLRLRSRLGPAMQAEHDVAYFGTDETERFNLTGQTLIYNVETDSDTESGLHLRGTARQEDHADNSVGVTTWTLQGRYAANLLRHAAEAGWFVRRLAFDDRIDESSTIIGRSTNDDQVQILVGTFDDSTSFGEHQYGFYVQDAIALLPPVILTAGLRAEYYTFNTEWTISPRMSLRYEASRRLTLTGATGVYFQSPTYRELRGAPAPGTTLASALNRGLRSQRSLQFVAGAELFVPTRRIYLRAETYLKRLRDVISYSLENVRIEYSGLNDAKGHTYGLDLQARGEFVPGMESWINYGFLVAREEFLPEFISASRTGSIARPTDQRHTVALFVQDYIPTDSTWKLHLRTLFGSGLPYTPPVPGERVGQIVVQEPGRRHRARFPAYRRVDIGATKYLTVFDRPGHAPVRLELTAELLNAFDIVNTVAYSWVPDAVGVWQRIPTRLTPRTFNVRLRATF